MPVEPRGVRREAPIRAERLRRPLSLRPLGIVEHLSENLALRLGVADELVLEQDEAARLAPVCRVAGIAVRERDLHEEHVYGVDLAPEHLEGRVLREQAGRAESLREGAHVRTDDLVPVRFRESPRLVGVPIDPLEPRPPWKRTTI